MARSEAERDIADFDVDRRVGSGLSEVDARI